jgi:formylglycine-generating enzyme required for sulfatase activity
MLKEPGLNLVDFFNRVGRKVRDLDANQQPYSTQPALEDFYFIPPVEKPPEVKIVTKPLEMGDVRQNPKDLLTYVWVLGGTFQMGCVDNDPKCRDNEKPRHQVTISKNFWLSSSEVTVTAYKRFLTQKPEHLKPRGTQMNYKGRSTEFPITNVSWTDAMDYCKWAGNDSGRLPREAEWEYAARAGKSGEIYPWGNDADASKANYKSKSTFEPVPVRSYLENPWHLFDMAGNAAEWVLDRYNPDAYKAAASTDPVENKGTVHVIRGGGFYDSIDYLRSSSRDYPKDDRGLNTIGFRCLLPNPDALK